MKYQHHPKQEYEELDGTFSASSIRQSDLQNSNTEPMKQEAGFYPSVEAITMEDRNWFYLPEPTLFERFNSLCTPAQYVQLKKEILAVCPSFGPLPKELEGFTEEILEML